MSGTLQRMASEGIITAETIRSAIVGLVENGAEYVTPVLIREALGLKQDDPRVRCALRDMVKRRELERIEIGKYRYNPAARDESRRDSEFYPRIWRAIRSDKPGFTLQDIALVTRVSYSHVRKYANFLEEAGYLARYGMAGQRRKWRATRLAQDTPEAPYPPRKIKDPFEREKNLALGLVQAFLLRDPYQPLVRGKIVENCRAILARFEKEDQDATA
jgi:hypothetical protein